MLGSLLVISLLNPATTTEAKNIDKCIDVINKIDIVTRRIYPVDIYPDANYHHGKVDYVEPGKNTTEAYRYNLIIYKPMNIKLHFISHVENAVDIKMIDADENVIKPFSRRVHMKYSPYSQTVALQPGYYTFSIYCLKAVGRKAQAGDFRFKFEEVN